MQILSNFQPDIPPDLQTTWKEVNRVGRASSLISDITQMDQTSDLVKTTKLKKKHKSKVPILFIEKASQVCFFSSWPNNWKNVYFLNPRQLYVVLQVKSSGDILKKHFKKM